MITVSILVPELSVVQAIADPQYFFSAINQFYEMSGKKPLFKVQLVGLKKEIKLNNGIYAVHPDLLLQEVKKTDLIIIPALFGDMATAIEKNKKLLPWINRHYANGAEVVSLCVGAFLLAATGLLDHKKCSTHWGFQNQFREMFPLVELIEGSIITESHRIYSSGGANSYWNLLLHLVEKYASRETAIFAAKYFAIDINRESQTSFAIFQGQKSHQDAEIKKIQTYIEKHFQDKHSVDALANKVALGRRSFERRFKQATNFPGYVLNDKHYWHVDGIHLNEITGLLHFNYNASASNSYLDSSWVKNTEDSIRLFYRPDATQEWQFANDSLVSGSLTDKNGSVYTKSILSGDYALGIKRSNFVDPLQTDAPTGPCNVITKVLESIVNPSFSIFPNPAVSKCQIVLKDGDDAPVRIQLFDIQGKCVLDITKYLNHGICSIEVESLHPGLYVLSLTDKNYNSQRFKLLKQ